MMKGKRALYGKYTCKVKLDFLKKRIKGLTLDVGCGKGSYIQELLKEGHNIIGLDIDAELIKYAKQHSKGEFVIGDAYNLPFRDKSFSTVICCSLLEHLKIPKDALWEVFRVTKLNALFNVPRIELLGHDTSHIRLYRDEEDVTQCLGEIPHSRIFVRPYFSCPFSFLKPLANFISRIHPSGYLAEMLLGTYTTLMPHLRARRKE